MGDVAAHICPRLQAESLAAIAQACQEDGCSVEAVSDLLDQLKFKKNELQVMTAVDVKQPPHLYSWRDPLGDRELSRFRPEHRSSMNILLQNLVLLSPFFY